MLKYFRKVALLESEIKELKKELEIKADIKRHYYDTFKKFESLDPSPLDSGTRKEYTSKVAGFFNDILNDKLECLIADQKDELSLIAQPEWKQNIIRANINILNLLLDWGVSMQSECMGSTQEDSEAEDRIKKIIT